MDMGWILILFIWLVAPFAQLGIIIYLLVLTDKYKKQIRELERGALRARAFVPLADAPGTGEKDRPVLKGDFSLQPDPPWQIAEKRAETWSPKETVLGEKPEFERGPAFQSVSVFQRETAIEEETPPCPSRGCAFLRPMLGTLALVLGMVFIVLAGLIFATTTWPILTDACKTYLVFACTLMFFGASALSQKVLGIRKTAGAFYILGSVFVFLSVLAAAHFNLLGPEFILHGENRWKVLFVGSAVTLGAFWAGIRRFSDKVYTQACLWGMSLTAFFLVKACSMGWNGFLCVMTLYSTVLIAVLWKLTPEGDWSQSGDQGEGSVYWRQLLAEGFRSFAPIHFWTFAAITMVRGLFSVWCMVIEGCMGVSHGPLSQVPLLSFTASVAVSVAAATAGIGLLARREPAGETLGFLKALAAAETILYTAGWLTDDVILRMAVIDLCLSVSFGICYWRQKADFRGRSLFWDVFGVLAMVLTSVSFYSGGLGRWDGMVLCLAAYGGFYAWFYLGERQWPHLVIAAAMTLFPFAARTQLGLTFDQMGFWTAAALLVSGGTARRFFPIIRRDPRVLGGWRADWHHILSILTILHMAFLGNDTWRFVYIFLAGLYFGQYMTVETLRRPALTLWALCVAVAFFQQPFVCWPGVLQLEMSLLPVVWFLWAARVIWKDVSWTRAAANAGYVICLSLLCTDAVFTGLVLDALLVEGICLAVFVWAQVKNCLWWARICASVCLAAALFMTKGFWLSIAWWVYLLAAGVGLLVFAGIMEKRR